MSELIDLLSDLVAIDSVNPDLVPGGAGEAAMADYVADWGRQTSWKSSCRSQRRGDPMSC